jgi:diketogulonate reductase-like aldo/keto reductase
MAQFALRWILMFDAVTVAIPGAKNAAQAQANGRAADLPPLSESQMTELKAIYDQDILPHGPSAVVNPSPGGPRRERGPGFSVKKIEVPRWP